LCEQHLNGLIDEPLHAHNDGADAVMPVALASRLQGSSPTSRLRTR
jgi:hypothetical protein